MDHFLQDGAGAHQLNAFIAFAALAEQVHAFEDFLLDAFALRHGRVGVVFVHQGDVEEYVLIIHIHAF